MKVFNVHEREFPAAPPEIGALIDSLSSEHDLLWPKAMWPAMRFDRPLGVGASGGHGPIRYVVVAFRPGQSVKFQFLAPSGFHGHHGFEVLPGSTATTRLRHTLVMEARGPALLSWSLVFRWLHDACVEDSLSVAEASLGIEPVVRPWSLWVKVLRWLLSAGRAHRQEISKPSEFSNVYDDSARAAAYAGLEFPGTYYLAYRDLPAIIGKHVQGKKALDFGCGTGRSSRFLRGLGFDVVGVDISPSMLAHARERDLGGDYRLVPDGDLGGIQQGSLDLILAAFTFDNVPTFEKKIALFRSLRSLLRPGGRIVTVVSSPDIYVNEWASFSTRDFPENRTARCGDTVRIVMLDVPDRRPVEDVLWTARGYQEVYEAAGLVSMETHRPLADPAEPFPWAAETKVAPWVVYVLAQA